MKIIEEMKIVFFVLTLLGEKKKWSEPVRSLLERENREVSA